LQRVDRIGRQRGRDELVTVLAEPAFELRRELRLHRGLADDDDTDIVVAGAGRCGEPEENKRGEEQGAHVTWSDRSWWSCSR
jgi:hypothetical protein